MLRFGLFSVPLLMLMLANSADAGIFRKPKPNSVQSVPELIKTLQSDTDESKRIEAAEALKEFDPKAHPDMIPALTTALLKDASSSVRSEAAQTLGKLRPVNQQIGFALEQALDNDSSIRVRMSARSSLWQYTLLGYRSGKVEEPKQEQTGEPPLAPAGGKDGPRLANIPLTQPNQPAKPVLTPNGSPARTQTQEPPLATPENEPPISKNLFAPTKSTPNLEQPIILPNVSIPRLQPTKSVPIDDDGPSLNPPK